MDQMASREEDSKVIVGEVDDEIWVAWSTRS